MAAPRASDMFQFVHVLATEVSTKAKSILAQIGSVVGKGQVDATNVKWLQHVGFASRPPKAVIGKAAASAIVVRLGNTEAAIASYDERGLALYGDLEDGETCIYAAGDDGMGQGRIILKKNGSINAYTRKGNTAGGVGMLFQMDAAAGAIRMVNDKGYGLIIDADGCRLFTDQGALTVGGNGKVSLVGTDSCQIDGTSICLGAVAVPGVNSVLCGVTGLVGVASTKVVCQLA